MKCKKCENTGSITFKNKGSYCEDCCIGNINHKFRARIGKYRLFSKLDTQNVLICLSGGASATVLLDLVFTGVSMTNSKKLKISPQFLHVIDTTSNIERNTLIAEGLIERCKKYNSDIHIISLAEFMISDLKNVGTNCIPPHDKNIEIELQNIMQSLPSATVKHDFIQKAKRKIFIKLARQLNCNYVFTAETTKSVGENILTAIVLGRGNQIENEVGFCDKRDDIVKILRPLIDITEEEVHHYLIIKQLGSYHDNRAQTNSLQSVLQTYVEDLQENAEATVSTMCKTADKIGMYDLVTFDKKCVICHSHLNEDKMNMNAWQATNFSAIVSSESLEPDAIINFNDKEVPNYDEFCYSCSRNYSETENSSTQKIRNLMLQ